MREIEDRYGGDAYDPDGVHLGAARKEGRGQGLGFAMALAGMVVCIVSLHGKLGGDSGSPAVDLSLPKNGGEARVGSLLRGTAPIDLHDHIRGPLSQWTNLAKGADWTAAGDYLRPGRLRLWKPSEGAADYDFEFVGQIDRKSLNWVFRAADARNYYAAKLALPRRGGDNSELVRYLMLNGHVLDREELPLPVQLERRADYRVRLAVRGGHFITYLDGQAVGSWSDSRISRGGVGFFSEEGGAALLKWANFSERDSLTGRILSYFSIFLLPPAIQQPAEW